MNSIEAIGQILAFLGSIALFACAVVAMILFFLVDRKTWARFSGVIAASVPVLYLFALVATSVFSNNKVLPPGAPKTFCEIDCHVKWNVVGVDNNAGTLVVTVRETFDPNSISSHRGDSPLTPGTRRFELVDAKGRHYRPSAEKSLSDTPLFAAMRPGETHIGQVVFKVPSDVEPLGLLVEDDDPVSRLLIGHERSLLHGKVLLSLDAKRADVQPTRKSSRARA
jgi:hypothetical protein